jgi:hypothetical protein
MSSSALVFQGFFGKTYLLGVRGKAGGLQRIGASILKFRNRKMHVRTNFK